MQCTPQFLRSRPAQYKIEEVLCYPGNKLINEMAKVIENNKNINTGNGINEDEIELAQKLDAIEEFTVDRFEENYVVLENRKTNEIINVNKNELPEGIDEGDILDKINGKYILDRNKTEEVSNRISDKMNNLWE